jgi:transcriptional regulator with XRE-family HTH domain
MSDIELGKANPTLTTLESIAGALGVSVGELFASPAPRRR